MDEMDWKNKFPGYGGRKIRARKRRLLSVSIDFALRALQQRWRVVYVGVRWALWLQIDNGMDARSSLDVGAQTSLYPLRSFVLRSSYMVTTVQ
jgi:hypothetical protein